MSHVQLNSHQITQVIDLDCVLWRFVAAVSCKFDEISRSWPVFTVECS